jgi:GR25 family glycosyltransferase involved in LPS biosynthesis
MISTYVVCIPKRRDHARAFLTSIGLNGIFLPPVMRDELDYFTLLRQNIIDPSFPDTPGYMGKVACSIAHANVLNAFLRSGEDAALVLEDDNHIPTDAKTRSDITNKIKTYQSDPSWQFLNLSPCRSQRRVQSCRALYPSTGQCMNAYMIRRGGAAKLLRGAFPLTREKHTLDVLIPDLGSDAYEVHPRLFRQAFEAFGTHLSNDNGSPEYCPKPPSKNVLTRLM